MKRSVSSMSTQSVVEQVKTKKDMLQTYTRCCHVHTVANGSEPTHGSLATNKSPTKLMLPKGMMEFLLCEVRTTHNITMNRFYVVLISGLAQSKSLLDVLGSI